MDAEKLSFLFQAEDGIRDLTVTGVQTCALPISSCHACEVGRGAVPQSALAWSVECSHGVRAGRGGSAGSTAPAAGQDAVGNRSEERRVGKEWRSRWSR